MCLESQLSREAQTDHGSGQPGHKAKITNVRKKKKKRK
jgi:hypothetical protein